MGSVFAEIGLAFPARDYPDRASRILARTIEPATTGQGPLGISISRGNINLADRDTHATRALIAIRRGSILRATSLESALLSLCIAADPISYIRAPLSLPFSPPSLCKPPTNARRPRTAVHAYMYAASDRRVGVINSPRTSHSLPVAGVDVVARTSVDRERMGAIVAERLNHSGRCKWMRTRCYRRAELRFSAGADGFAGGEIEEDFVGIRRGRGMGMLPFPRLDEPLVDIKPGSVY
jgi:hypothetical protein